MRPVQPFTIIWLSALDKYKNPLYNIKINAFKTFNKDEAAGML
jgi:hypothetical protein